MQSGSALCCRAFFPTADGEPSAAYLDRIEEIVDMLWEKEIYSVIDLHQDVLSPEICGEGSPSWMWNVSELNALDFPLPMSFSNRSKADPATGKYNPAPNCKERGIASLIGWSGFYMTDASGKAFSKMYTGETTLGKMVEKYWKVVAQKLVAIGILFYELLNEPWLGDHVGDPLLLLKGGEAERKAVGPYMEKMEKVVHDQDALTPVLFAPAELNNRLMRSVGYEENFLTGNPMAYHVYCVVGTDGPGPTTPLTKGFATSTMH